MKSKLKLGFIGVILIVIGAFFTIIIQLDSTITDKKQAIEQEIKEIQDNQELTTNEKHYTIEQLTTQQVEDENDIEETPVSSEEIITSEEIDMILEDKQRVLAERLGSSFEAKKQTIDSSFTCDNYHILSYQYRDQAYAGFTINGKYDGTFEGYVYWKAFNECIDVNYSTKYNKVFEELEKVNAEN